MVFSSHIHWFVLLCLILGAWGFAFWTYRTTIPPIGRGKKNLLIFLRTVALALILLLLAEPLLRLTQTIRHRPVVALVADNSLSLTLTDALGNREAHLRAVFSDPSWERMASDVDIERFAIAPELIRTTTDSLVLHGASTDLGSALARLISHQHEAPAAIVLLSDGNYNTGANPLGEAERSPIPIFTIGIGDSADQKDAAVAKVTGNSIAYVETSVPIDGLITVSGYSGAQLHVQLLEEGRLIEERTIASGPSTERSEYPVQFHYEPKTDGMKKLTVHVQELTGEATTKNNSRSFVMKVLKSKLRTLVLAGAPGADAAAVMQTLEGDRNGDPVIFYQTPDGRLRGEKTTASFSSAAAGADCMVLVGFPTAQTSLQTLQTVVSTVQSKSIPLFFIAGRMLDLQKLRQLESVLPFTVAGVRLDEQQVVASVPPAQQFNILMTADGSSSMWEKLPPIYSTLGVFKAKPEAAVLATMKMQGVPLSVPLIVSRNVGSQKSIAILGYGIARWKLLAGASSETERFFAAWFSTASRWLSVREEDKRLRVETDKELFSQGEPVAFTGQAYTETFDPLDNAEIHIEAVEQRSQQKSEIVMHGVGAGRYEAALTGLSEGEYQYSATAQSARQAIGSVHGRFSVGEQALEFTDTKLNTTLMRQIASLSGGTYAPGNNYGTVIDRLKQSPILKPEEHAVPREYDMWNVPPLFFVIILCTGVEWFIRKRSGMV